MAKTKQQDRVWFVPQLEVRISESWVRMVRRCQTEFPDGVMRLTIANAEPKSVLDWKPNIRFDKEQRPYSPDNNSEEEMLDSGE